MAEAVRQVVTFCLVTELRQYLDRAPFGPIEFVWWCIEQLQHLPDLPL